MKISQRIQKLTTSPIRKLAPYAEAAMAAGKKVYHLNIGQPDIITPPEFMESIRNYDENVIAYGNSKGEPFLIKAIQDYYATKGMTYAAEDIYITNGGSEALTFAVMALCDKDEEIMVFEPYYANYNSFTNQYEARVNAVKTSVENGYHLPSREEIEAQITPHTRAMLITNPSNPTGVVYTEEEMQLLADLALKYDLALIADEVYREFIYDGSYRSFGTLPGLDEHLIIIDSISKRYSACGARIGCIISKNKVFCQQMMKCCQARLCSPILEQVGAAALYKTPASYLEEVNQEYKRRRDTMVAELAKLPGVKFSDPKGAFYIMVSLPVDDSEKFAIWLLEHFSLNNETLMFAPGNGFYGNPLDGQHEARLAYVLNCQDLTKAVRILGAALEAYPGRTL